MPEQIILDVRTDGEYQAERVKGSIDIPLDFIEVREGRIGGLLSGKDVLIICRTGIRAEVARKILASHWGIRKLTVFPGGIVEYKKQFPKEIVVGHGISRLPIMRQVQVVSGGLIVAFSMMGFLIHTNFFLWAILIGAGLIFAGVTGFCGLATLLGRLPFNK